MGSACRRCFSATSGALLEYDTSKLVHIRNQKIGLIYRLVQLVVIVYIIGYVIVIQKGYQETDTVVSSVTTKLKGIAFVEDEPGAGEPAVWDVADYVVPPEQTDAVFVTTNAIITTNQSYGVCNEDENVVDGSCESDSDCPAGVPVRNGNGVRNGTCDLDVKTCFISAWCPTENDTNRLSPLLGDYPLNFTLLIKNNIQFQKFNFTKSNILASSDRAFLQNCTYDSEDPERRFCPIFRLGHMFEEAAEDYSLMALKGGVMGVFIKWDCNLDNSATDCKPEYKFKRLDNAAAPIAPGYSFRYPIYYMVDNVMHRQLIKAYGIRFQILVTGTGGKFSVVPLFLNIGSGIALLGISTLICDLLVLYVVKRRKYYKDNKFQMIEDEEALLGFVEDSK